MTAPARRRVAAWLAALCLGAVAVAQVPEVGDALGAGLTPPTAARYADPAWYDLLDARWATDAQGAAVLELELAAIDPEAPLLQPIVEAYLLSPDATGRSALPGTGLEVVDDGGWAVAVRLAGDGAWAWTAALDAPLRARPMSFEVVGRTVRLAWPSDLPAEGSWVAISGVYDPFSETGWRPFATEASPWAFKGPAATPPVVSVVPGGDDALLRLHATARLPRGVVASPLATVSPWWWLMGAGMLLVAVGLTWRGGRSPAVAPPAAPPSTLAPVPPLEPVAEVPPALIGDDDVALTGGATSGRSEGPTGASEGATAVQPEGATAVQPEGATAVQADGATPGRSEDATPGQSEPEERVRGVATTAATVVSEPAAEAEVDDDASSSARTTRAPSEASRSAKRS